MEIWYPGAIRRPLGDQTEDRITPRVFVVHTMVGHLKGTDGMFRRGGYDGTESHFGIGCPTDGADLDGVVYQWQRLDYSADAQGAGNAYATSVETADGGDPDNPWSPKQINALVTLGAWWAREFDAPVRLITATNQKGFSYHRAFAVWNPNKHSCPGNVRLRQYTNVVIPRIAALVSGGGKPTPPGPASRGNLNRTLGRGDTGGDVKAVQRLLGVPADGDYGPVTHTSCVGWQRKRKLTDDGMFGPSCARAAGWTWKGKSS